MVKGVKTHQRDPKYENENPDPENAVLIVAGRR